MSGTRILVVEDERIVAEDLKGKLEAMGYAVVHLAASGEEAVQAARETRPDLVLMDVQLSGEMDGVQAADLVRRELGIPVVYLTAYADDETLERAKVTEPFGYLVKPFGERELRSAIEISLYRNRVEQELRRGREWLATTLASIADAVIATDADGRVAFMNGVAERLTGWAEDDAKGQPLGDVFAISDEKTGVPNGAPLDKALHDGEVVSITDHVLLSRQGELIPIDDTGAPIRDHTGAIVGAVVVFRDVTERRRAQAATIETSRLDATATLAGGVAHRFNNLMTAVMGYANLLKSDLVDQPGAEEMLDCIANASRQAAELTQQMLAFARRGKYHLEVLDLNGVVQDALALYGDKHGDRVRLTYEAAPDLWAVRADRVQMIQVFVNVYLNAVEAIDGRGSVRVSTANVAVKEGDPLPAAGMTPGDYVGLVVEDSGRGIGEVALCRVFEPFYSTKDLGRGLGLAAVHGIVRNHCGFITVTTASGRGTTFRVYLPASRSLTPAAPESAIARGSETVLVVDDEEMVRDVLEESLGRLGYRVLVAGDGKQAVDIARTHDGEIHAAVLDMEMPVMDGSHACPLLMDARPEIKIVIYSGYELDERSQALLEAGADAFARKPFSAEALGRRIRTLLDAGE